MKAKVVTKKVGRPRKYNTPEEKSAAVARYQREYYRKHKDELGFREGRNAKARKCYRNRLGTGMTAAEIKKFVASEIKRFSETFHQLDGAPSIGEFEELRDIVKDLCAEVKELRNMAKWGQK